MFSKFVAMDYEIDLKFNQLKAELEKKFGPGMDLQAILFLVGVDKLGIGHKNFSKNEKVEQDLPTTYTTLSPT